MNLPAAALIGEHTPEFMAYRKRIKSREHLQQVQSVEAWRDQVEAMIETPWQERGTKLPWAKTNDKVRLRPGELSLWAGKNSHGKSSVLGQILAWLAATDEKVMVASFEMPVWQTIERMMRQATGCENPTQEVRNEFWEKFAGKLYFYDFIGTINPDLVMDLCEFSAEILGCKHIQIDSLTKIRGMVSDKNDVQADFINDLHSSAKHFGIHVHLVAHEKKGEGGGDAKLGGRFDIKGSGAIPDQVDNVFIVWQDRKKQSTDYPENEKPDTLLKVDKQRHGMWIGCFGLWFASVQNWQFVEHPNIPRMHCPGMSYV